jgi:hypothetical protein
MPAPPQDLEEDLFFRWATPEKRRQSTFAERQFFLQVRHAVQQGLIVHLESKTISQAEVFDEI